MKTVKVMKFRSELVDPVLRGEKTSTWRLFDDKGLSEGDEIQMLVWGSKEPFARSTITSVIEKRLDELTVEDKEGHETYGSDAEMYETFKGYYGQHVGPETSVKIIRFELVTR